MRNVDLDCEAVRQLITATILGPDFCRATFGGAVRSHGPCPWARVVIRPIKLRGERHLQFSYFDAKKDVTKNFRAEEVHAPIEELLDVSFAGIHLATLTEEIDVRTTKKGKVSVGRRPVSPSTAVPDTPTAGESHNRIKEVPLPEGLANRLLEVMGILTADGRVRPTMRAKYTQINEFLKHLLHVLDVEGFRSLGREVEILDCGCGSSYLTLAVHHYLNDVLNVPSRITGVDVNEEVIRKSTQRADQLGANGLAFTCGRIREARVRPDVVLALHACDVATDEAIAQAVLGGAKLLLSVPCCHHNLNKAIRAEGEAAPLRPLLRNGILRERTADLVTDAFRAQALRIMGYRTDVVEFVSTEHTARNLMIRAVRGAMVGNEADVHEYLEMRRFWDVVPYVEKALGEPFQNLLNGDEKALSRGHPDVPCSGSLATSVDEDGSLATSATKPAL